MLDIRDGVAPPRAQAIDDPGDARIATELKPAERAGDSVQGRVLRALVRPLWVIAICSVVAVLRAARDALVPLALALLVAFVLSGIVEWLRRRGVPRALSGSVLLIGAALAIGAVIELTWSPAQQWMQNAPRVLHTIERRVRPAQSLLRRLDYIAKRATAIATSDGDAAPAAAAPSAGTAAPATALVTPLEVFAATGWLVTGIVTVVAFALLVLIAGPPALARMTVALAANLRAVHVLQVIEAIRLDVGRYYGTMLLINLGFGVVVAGVMSLLGMPNPVLWGAIAGVLNFIPFVGSAATFSVVTIVALVTFDSIAHVLLVAGSYLCLAAVEGHVIEPVFFGKSLDLNPLVVLTALWLGGWLWGVPGVVLAVPAAVAVRSVRRVSGRTRHPPLLP